MKKVLFSVAIASALATAAPAMAQTIGFATLPQGSLFHTMGSVMAKVVRDSDDIRMVVQPYGGTSAALSAVDAGEAEFTVLDANEAYVAVTGQHAYEGRDKPNLRIVMRLRPVQVGIFVRKDSDITKTSDLKGKRYPSGWEQFPNGKALSEGVFAASAMSFDDIDPVPTPTLIRAADDFVAGKVDGTIFALGAPKVAEVDAATGGIRFLPVETSDIALARMREVRPAYYVTEAKPLPHLVGVVAPTPLLTWDMVILAGTHVADETVGKFLTAMAGNKEALVAGFPGFIPFVPKRMAKAFPAMEYHPGAVAYYEANGMWPPPAQ